MRITEEMNDFYYHMSMYELQMMNEKDYYNGLSYNSLLYLNVIEQMEECTVSSIADMLHVTRSAVTLKLNELVRQGAVMKTQSEDDKRVFYVKLSPRMKRTFGFYDEVFNEIERKLERIYSKEQLALFAEILHTISGIEWKSLATQKFTGKVEEDEGNDEKPGKKTDELQE